MGKKDKSGKKKGPLKTLSKYFTSWKNKKAGKGSEDETSSKEVCSESAVANISQSDLTSAVVEKDVDTTNVTIPSEGHSRSHFHIACENDEVKEVLNSKREVPNVSESTKTSQKALSKYSKDTNMQSQESHLANDSESMKTDNKFNRFTVTAVPDEATTQNSCINRTTSNELDGVKHMTKEKEQSKAWVSESISNCVDHANVIQKPETQISQSNHSSDKFMDIKKHNELDTPQNKLNSVMCKNEDKVSFENHSCQPSLYVNKSINFTDKELSELQDQQLSITPQSCAKHVVEHSAPRNEESTHSLKNQINDHCFQLKINHASSSSSNSNDSENHIKLKPCYSSENYKNGISEKNSQIEVCQSDVSLANCISNVDEQHDIIPVDQIQTNEKFLESELCQSNSSSFIILAVSDPDLFQQTESFSIHHSSSTYTVQHSEAPTLKPYSNSGDHIKDIAPVQGKSESCNYMKNSESHAWKENLKTDSFNTDRSKAAVLTSEKENLGTDTFNTDRSKSAVLMSEEENLGTDTFNTDRSKTAVLMSEEENLGTDNSEVRDASIVGAHTRESLHGLSASSLSTHSNNLNLDQINLDQYKPGVDDDDSNIDSEDEPPELTFVSQIENENNQISDQFSFTSHSNDNSQVSSEYKDDGVPFHSVDKNDNPSDVSKYNDEIFKKRKVGETAESYPISQAKETSERSTKSYLPYLASLKESESRKALSDLTTNRNSYISVDNNIELRKQEKQSPEPKGGESIRKDDTASEQRTPSSANSIRHSRLPVRKSLGSENIVDRISKLSDEIEELRTDTKQKSDNRPRSNTSTPARSKIPRKYVSSSAVLHSK